MTENDAPESTRARIGFLSIITSSWLPVILAVDGGFPCQRRRSSVGGFESCQRQPFLGSSALHVQDVRSGNKQVCLSAVLHTSVFLGSEKIELREDLKSRRGLAVSLEIICHNCGESTSTMSSKISNKCYDVNLRLTYGMRAIEKVELLLEYSLCGLMNLPPPPRKV
ncbi:hypothetical protein TNCV_2033601 [Trichonephila clavipes]|nr:hypothetical protein TNCV_2033601 [Trichonephila clavipes]